MRNKNFMMEHIEKKIKLISKSLKLGFIITFIFLLIIFLYSKSLPTPIFWAILSIGLIMAFLPYFYLKNKYEKWYISNVYSFIIKEFDNDKQIELKIPSFTKHEINHCKVFQNIDLIESRFSIFIQSEFYKIKLEKLNCFNYINYKINNKNVKEGQKLPVFEGMFICIEQDNFDLSDNLILISKNILKSNSSMSNLRFRNNLYLDGVTMNIENNDFDLYLVDKKLNYSSEIKNILNFSKIYDISKYLIISIQDNKIFLIFPGKEYFEIFDKIKLIEAELDKNIDFITNIIQVVIKD